MLSKLRDCEEETFHTKCYVINNDIGQPEEDASIVENKLEELNDDINNKETLNR